MLTTTLSRSRAGWLSLSLVVLTLSAPGCGRSHPKTAYVTGKVTVDGEPLSTGSIVFVPDPTGQYASGQIKPDGTYTLTTFENGDGALLGKHKIMVTAQKDQGMGLPFIELAPKIYSSEKTSGLEATIEDHPNQVDLELKSKPAKKK